MVISKMFAATMMAIPVSRIGRRPIRSTSSSDTNTEIRVATWTNAGKPRKGEVAKEAHQLEDPRAAVDDRVDPVI